jgi:hypothetical protein
MKTFKLFLFSIVPLTLTLSACDYFKLDKGEPIELEKIIPKETSILIPSTLNYNNAFGMKKSVEGDNIYNFVRAYINIADEATKIIEKSYERIIAIETPGILEFSYTGVDGNTKKVSIKENYNDTINELKWDYYMEIYNRTFADLALKAWWNVNPNEQKIIFKPASLNTSNMINHQQAIVEIEYKAGEAASPYEKALFVAIDGLTGDNEISFAPENILIYIAQNGGVLEITGASSNPDAALLDYDYRGGRNWSFFANVNTSENIAAVQLALPPSNQESIENLFSNYSLKQVILDEIRTVFPSNDMLSDQELFNLASIDGSLLENPGYFDSQGFVSAGTAPTSSYSALSNFEGFVPFVPAFVRDYEVTLSNSVITEEVKEE